jgi:hypothetical protein
VAGPNLADLVARRGPLPADQQRALAIGLAEALAAVHRAGVVHRDLKPTNVLCSPAGPRLIDFGIAQAADASSVTLTGQLVGSPTWMAPEQIRGEAATPAMDMFALGSVLVFAATGQGPFGQGEMAAVMYRILNEAPDLGPAGALAPELVPIVGALLSKEPASRPRPSRILTDLAGTSADPARAVTAILDRTWVLPAGEMIGVPQAAGISAPDPRLTRQRWWKAVAAATAVAAGAILVAALLLAKPAKGHNPQANATSSIATTLPAPSVTTNPVTTGLVEGPLPLPSGSPPAPVLSDLLSPDDHVVSESWVRLTGKTPQVVVTYTKSVASPNGTATDLVLFAWDGFAKRWVPVFDAANAPAPDSSSNQDILPANALVTGLTHTTITPTPGRTDLTLSADYTFGADVFSATDILHYDGQTASVVYSGDSGGKVTGAVPHQQLTMTNSWVDPVDAACCPVRNYTQTVGWDASPLPGTSIPTGYQLLSDTRSWMGVYVATRVVNGSSTGTSSSPPPVVMSVASNSPASGLLQPGDQLLSVSGIPQPSNPAMLGPVIIEQIDSQQPGTVVALSILRGDKQLTENITLSSYANPAEGQAIPPAPGFLGVEADTSSPSSTPGAYIQTVVSGTAASQAGLQSGDVITSVGTSRISSPQDLTNALFAIAAGTTSQLGYVDSAGVSHTVNVTLGVWPSSGTDSTVQPVQKPIIDEI